MSSDLKERKAKKGIGFRYAWKGLVEVCRKEKNFRFHLTAAFLAVLAGIVTGLVRVEWAVLTMTISSVLCLEMINSSIERILDYLAPEEHPQAGIIKDIAAGAVLVASAGSVVVGLFLFLPKLISLL